ncbi:hypothetical protein G3I13_02355 [Streptomyces sp. SID6673]|nr:hypothetical protein [Streptomyces sp. SID11726]NDZ95006.1 hypothetical protein [Streptomyces sp. SID11726]NEB23164.1 hypothetical protein [Streptomyces sp. SID6673]
MCRVTSPLTRRAVLRGGLAVTVGTVAAATVAACDSGPSPEQITAAALVPLADAAFADQASAQSLAPRTPEYANALGVVAEQRGEHAEALREEVARLDEQTAGRISVPGAATPSSASPSSPQSAPPNSPSAPVPTASTVDALRAQLARSARTAGDASVNLSGYSAGLAGAVGASVTSMVEVQLA